MVSGKAPDTRRRSILYVERDRDLWDAMTEYLGAYGYGVVTVRTAEEALAILEEPGRFQLLLTNYRLTCKSGERLFREVGARGLLPQASVIVFSGEPAPVGIEGYRFVPKHGDAALLLNAITAALGSAGDDNVSPPARRPNNGGAPELVELRLYLSPGSRESRTAASNLRQILETFDKSSIRLDVHELSPANERSLEMAEADRVMVTPTLVRVQPLPKLWVLGDLSKRDLVERIIADGLNPADEPD